MKKFYDVIAKSEATHYELFVRLAKERFEESVVDKRLAELLEAEAKVVESLPIRARLH